MIRKLTKLKKWRRKEANSAAVMAIYDRAVDKFPVLICHLPNTGVPNTSHLNFQREGSHVAGTLGYRQSRFSDSRGVPYTRDEKGTVRRVRVEKT